MSSPVLSEFSDIAALSADRNDGQDLLLSDPLGDNFKNAVSDTIEMLPPLDCFVPIIKKLPGLFLDNNQYFVNGPLLMTELPELVSYTRRISELVLTDAHSTEPEVASETLVQLALIQDPKNPFLSSLHCLRLIDADKSLSYLFFCITPSLRTLEIVGAPLNRKITISNFIKGLVLGAPQLANIILRDSIPENVLKCIPNFKHLRQLHLIDTAKTLDFAFLQELSVLSDLEDLLIKAGTAEYTAFSATPTAEDAAEPGLNFTMLVDGQSTSCTEYAYTPFRCLRKLTITSNVLLMKDLVFHLLPQSVKDIALTLVQNFPPKSYVPVPASSITDENDSETFPEDPVYAMSLEELEWICKQTGTPVGKKTSARYFESKDGKTIRLSISEKQRYMDHLAARRDKQLKIENIRLEQEKELNELRTCANSQTSTFGDVVEQILDLALPKSFFLDHLWPGHIHVTRGIRSPPSEHQLMVLT